MSPRRPDGNVRTGLVEVAARILATEGPTALTTRRITAEFGTSTMAVYTHFGGMQELVREMVREGFARLSALMQLVEETDDPVSDVATLGRAYRLNAVSNPHLYAVMLGGSSLGGFSLTAEDRQLGRYTLAFLVEAVTRAVAGGRFRPQDAELQAHQLWAAMHGVVTLELGGFLVPPYDADTTFDAQVRDLMIGAGDQPARADASLAGSRQRAEALPVPAAEVSARASPGTTRSRSGPAAGPSSTPA